MPVTRSLSKQRANIISLGRGRGAPIRASDLGDLANSGSHPCTGAQGREGSPVVFNSTKPSLIPSAHDDGKRRVAKASYVFNCSQVDGYTPPAQF
jgi:hypothetical protein